MACIPKYNPYQYPPLPDRRSPYGAGCSDLPDRTRCGGPPPNRPQESPFDTSWMGDMMGMSMMMEMFLYVFSFLTSLFGGAQPPAGDAPPAPPAEPTPTNPNPYPDPVADAINRSSLAV